MSELAAQTSLTPSGLTRSVDRLQDQGLVARRVCPEDRGARSPSSPRPGRSSWTGPSPTTSPTSTRCSSDLFTAEEEETLASLLRTPPRPLSSTPVPNGPQSEDDGDVCPGAE